MNLKIIMLLSGQVRQIFKGIELYNSFKSDKIVFTGGKTLFNKTAVSEGMFKKLCFKYGILKKTLR